MKWCYAVRLVLEHALVTEFFYLLNTILVTQGIYDEAASENQ